jgi:hypothetical protein
LVVAIADVIVVAYFDEFEVAVFVVEVSIHQSCGLLVLAGFWQSIEVIFG